MFQTFEQAQQAITEQGIQVVDLKFCDLWGAGITLLFQPVNSNRS